MFSKINKKTIFFILVAGLLMNLFSSNDEPVESQDLPAVDSASIVDVQNNKQNEIIYDKSGSDLESEATETQVPGTLQDINPLRSSKNVVESEPIQERQVANESNNNFYINSEGNSVQSPTYSETVPAGATAECRDGTYSFSQNRQGTCSHHGGVARWL